MLNKKELTSEEVSKEIELIQKSIKDPLLNVRYRDFLARLKYLRNKQTQIKRKVNESTDRKTDSE